MRDDRPRIAGPSFTLRISRNPDAVTIREDGGGGELTVARFGGERPRLWRPAEKNRVVVRT